MEQIENGGSRTSVDRVVLRLDKDYATALLGKLSAMKTLAECIESKTADVNLWIRCLGLGIEVAREIEPQLRAVVYEEYVQAGFVCPKCWDRCNGYGNGCRCSPTNNLLTCASQVIKTSEGVGAS